MDLDSLYCGKWRKISKSRRDLDLDQKMPNVELIRAIFIYYNICSSFKWIEPLSYCVHRHTHRQTDRQTDTKMDGRTDRQTDTHTDGHEYSIVAVDKPQL